MSEQKKKSYSKKPSKKERLAAELAQKQLQQQEDARVKAGGVFVRADGVAVSSAALAARQKALQAALGEASALSPHAEKAEHKKSRSHSRHKTDASPSIVKIEPASESGKRLAQCLWCAQVLLQDVLVCLFF